MITITKQDGSIFELTPSKLNYSLTSVSNPDAGRDLTGLMYAEIICYKRKLELVFNTVEWQEASRLLQAVHNNPDDGDPEYFQVTYPDMLSGEYETRTFYCGDRTAPVYCWLENKKLLSEVAYNIIER